MRADQRIGKNNLVKAGRIHFRDYIRTRGECIGAVIAVITILAFGAILETRTAFRRVPMTDLGVPVCASWAALHGDNIYKTAEWHNWHYGYPPALAILFIPFAHPPPTPLAPLRQGEVRTDANTPWGYEIPGQKHCYRFRQDNVRFFWIVAAWYLINVFLIVLSAHALACTLERTSLREPPPVDGLQRKRWWLLRTLPLLACAGSLVTDLARGQVDVLLLAAIAISLYLASRRREFASGCWLVIPAAIKVFPILLLGYPIWRRRWKMLLGALASLVFLFALLPAITLGPNRTVDLYRTWFNVIIAPGLGAGTDTSRAEELTAMNRTDNQSLLAFFHNWQYHEIIRERRPAHAVPAARIAVYAVGALMLFGIGCVAGRRCDDSPRNLVLLTGLLIGLALIINPVVHNYYYLLLLPLIAALLDYRLTTPPSLAAKTNLPWLLIVFMLIDFLARMAIIGPWLRDIGAPLVSVCLLLAAAAIRLHADGLMTKPFFPRAIRIGVAGRSS